MDAEKIAILLKVVDSGSMMKASGELGYTPSGLVHIMDSIEHELGLKIMDRTNRGVVLTEDGKELLPLFKKFVRDDAQILVEAKKLRDKNETTLHVGTYASIATHWLPSVIAAFCAEHPGFGIDFETLGMPECYEALDEGRIDLAFCSLSRSAKCNFEPLKDDEFFAVLPPESTFAPNDDVFPIESFNGLPFIMPSFGTDEDVRNIITSHDVHPKPLASVAEDSAVVSMVAAGMGVSLLSDLVLRGRTENIKALHVQPNVYRTLGIIYRDESVSTIGRTFTAFAKSMKASL